MLVVLNAADVLLTWRLGAVEANPLLAGLPLWAVAAVKAALLALLGYLVWRYPHHVLLARTLVLACVVYAGAVAYMVWLAIDVVYGRGL